jgi:hypothetical protein
MKKFILVAMFVFGLTSMAQAFTVPAEVQISPTPESYCDTQPETVAVASVKQGFNEVKAAINKADTKTAKSVDVLSTKIDKLTDKDGILTKTAADVKAGNTATANLDKKLTDEKNGEFKKLKDTYWSVGAELAKDLKWMAFWIILAIVIAVVVILRSQKRSFTKTDVKIEKIPEASAELTAKAVELQGPITLTVAGKNYLYTPRLVNGKRRSLSIAKGLLVVYANPAEIPCSSPPNAKKMASSVEDIIEKDNAGEFNGSDPHSQNQKAVIKLAKDNDELVEL